MDEELESGWKDLKNKISRQQQDELIGVILKHNIPVSSKIELFAEWYDEWHGDIYQDGYPPSAKDDFGDWMNGKRQNKPLKRVEKNTALVAHYGGEVERAIKINPEIRYVMLEAEMLLNGASASQPEFMRSVPDRLETESASHSRAELEAVEEIKSGIINAARHMKRYVGLAKREDRLLTVDTGSSNAGSDESTQSEERDDINEDEEDLDIAEQVKKNQEIHADRTNRGEKIPDFGLQTLLYGRLALYFETVTNPEVIYHVLEFGDESIEIIGALEADELVFKSQDDLEFALDNDRDNIDSNMNTKERIRTAARETLSVFLADSFYRPEQTTELTDVTRAFDPSNLDDLDDLDFDPSSLKALAEGKTKDDIGRKDLATINRWRRFLDAEIDITPQEREDRIVFSLTFEIPRYLQ